jgi:Helix-turn-helix domain
LGRSAVDLAVTVRYAPARCVGSFRSFRHAGKTPAAVARRLGETRSWLSNIEGGHRWRVDVVEFIALAQTIGFDPAKALRKLQRSLSRRKR